MNKITLTKFNVAIIDGDTHLSKWIEQEGRLDVPGLAHDAAARFIKPGDVVVDAGASLGDHTLVYLNAVGESGTVYAFEPNPMSFEALEHNCPAAICRMAALGKARARLRLKPDSENVGATYIDVASEGDTHVLPLDELGLGRLNFFKMDVEGMEPLVIDGADGTIKRCKPIILLEVNHGALQRAGFTVEDIVRRADALNYRLESVDPQYGLELPQTDVYLIPK